MSTINLKLSPFISVGQIDVYLDSEANIFVFSANGGADFFKSRDGVYLYENIKIPNNNFLICKNIDEEVSYRIFCIPLQEFLINKEAEEKFLHSDHSHLPALKERGKIFDFPGIIESGEDFIHLRTGEKTMVYTISEFQKESYITDNLEIVSVKKILFQGKNNLSIKFKNEDGTFCKSFFLIDKGKFFNCKWEAKEYEKFSLAFSNYLVIDEKCENEKFVFELNKNRFFVLPNKLERTNFFSAKFAADFIVVKTKKTKDEEVIWYLISTVDWCRHKVSIPFEEFLNPILENGKLFVEIPKMKIEIK